MNIDLSNLVETSKEDKIIVDKLAFVVDVTNPKRPYYSILYHPINSEEENMGFGSYNQNFVKQWKDEYFIVKTTGDINELYS